MDIQSDHPTVIYIYLGLYSIAILKFWMKSVKLPNLNEKKEVYCHYKLSRDADKM